MDEYYLIDLLTQQYIINETQANEVKDKMLEENKAAIDCLEELEYASEEQVLQILAVEYSMETFDLEGYVIPEEVIQVVPPDIAKRYRIVPIMKTDAGVTVGISDPTKFMEILDSLHYLLNQDIDAMVVKKADLKRSLDTYYGSTEEAMSHIMQEMTQSEVDIEIANDDDKKVDRDGDSPIIKLVSLIIADGYKLGASDIHLEPMERRFRIRFRIDGVLHEQDSPPKYLQNNIIQRCKIMAMLDITEKRVPQDGRIQFRMPNKEIDLRVSTVPTKYGESIVMRILDKANIQLGVAELGFFHDDQVIIEKVLALPDGIFLVTGPTGSGKTTSLYAFLNSLNTPNRKIITAEDPVEYELSGINQVQCSKHTITFDKALRSMLRQAPNIVMVGEIRDIETGSIAINAALTGHLVFSTLHTNDAPTAVTRLIDMGVKPFLVASAVRAVMAQRLVRSLCKECKTPTPATDEEIRLLEADEKIMQESTFEKGTGCSKCNNSGYKGRMGIYEIFSVTKSIVDLIYANVPSDEIKAKAREEGMRTLRDDGLRKAANGMTSLEELIRVTKSNEEGEFA